MVEEVRRLTTEAEVRAALELSRRVFDEFVAVDYEARGRDTFYMATDPCENISRWHGSEYVFYGAFEGELMKGMAASRMGGSHVMLLFVDKAYHRQGVAKRLMAALIQDAPKHTLTVNASHYGVGAYERMGFKVAGPEVTEQGMTFTPMKYTE